MATTTRKLGVATKPTENPAYPVAYRVHDEHGNSMAMCSGLFGWGWSGSRDAALLSAGVTEADVEAAEQLTSAWQGKANVIKKDYTLRKTACDEQLRPTAKTEAEQLREAIKLLWAAKDALDSDDIVYLRIKQFLDEIDA